MLLLMECGNWASFSISIPHGNPSVMFMHKKRTTVREETATSEYNSSRKKSQKQACV